MTRVLVTGAYPEATEPARYHIVGEQEVSNLRMAELDGGKLAPLGWEPPVPLMESIKRTVRWTLQHPE